jgi:hypothetical protein
MCDLTLLTSTSHLFFSKKEKEKEKKMFIASVSFLRPLSSASE